MHRTLTLALAVLGLLASSGLAEARDPEILCAGTDAHRLEIKPRIMFYDPKADMWSRSAKGEPIASCEIRSRDNRTIFQRYEGGKVVVRGFFLEGKRSGRWIQNASATIYAGGSVIQETPLTQCDIVARISAAVTVYCPRGTRWAEMVSDFRQWQRALRPKMLVFDVYSNEPKTPASTEAYKAFPEHSEVNFAVIQFEGDKLDSFRCIRAGEKTLRSCHDLLTK
jgi:hypothetical protein